MTTATTPIPAWPAPAVLLGAASFVTDASRVLDELALTYHRLNNGGDEPLRVPTYGELGRLTSFIQCVETELEAMKGHLEAIKQAQHGAAAALADAE